MSIIRPALFFCEKCTMNFENSENDYSYDCINIDTMYTTEIQEKRKNKGNTRGCVWMKKWTM